MKKPEILNITRESKLTVYESVVTIIGGDEHETPFQSAHDALEHVLGEIAHCTVVERKHRTFSVRVKTLDVSLLDEDEYSELTEQPVTLDSLTNALMLADVYPVDCNYVEVDPYNQTIKVGQYDYPILEALALSGMHESTEAAETAISALAEWFERFDSADWNGECYKVDSTHNLRPVYDWSDTDEDGIPATIGWELT